MSIRDELNHLLECISRAAETKKTAHSSEILVQTHQFFKKLKQELKSASPSEKAEIFDMIKSLHAKIEAFSKQSADDVGKSEDELLALADDSSLFNDDQKAIIDLTRQDMIDSKKLLKDRMGSDNEDKIGSLHKPGKAPKSKKIRRKDTWKKS